MLVFVIVCFHSNGWLILCLFLTHCLHELECWCFHFPVRNLINVKIMSSILGQEPMKPQINVSPSAILCLDHPSHYYQEQMPHNWDPWETTYIQKNIPWNVKFFGCYYPASWWHGSLLPTVTEPESLWCLAWEMGGYTSSCKVRTEQNLPFVTPEVLFYFFLGSVGRVD